MQIAWSLPEQEGGSSTFPVDRAEKKSRWEAVATVNEANADESTIYDRQMDGCRHLSFEHLSSQYMQPLSSLYRISRSQMPEMAAHAQPQPADLCIHMLISDRAVAAPSTEAVCGWNGRFTYGRLDELSSKLAARLIAAGVRPSILVPFCLEKSIWTVVAILGILKAGGAFVPLDHAHPLPRLREIVQRSRASFALCSTSTRELCLGLVDTVLVVEEEVRHTSYFQIGNANPDDAAYVIFTSGTTGKPKGLVNTHRAFCLSALSHGPAHRISPGARVLQFASYSFDASLVEILTTLIMGACVCIPSEDQRINDLSGSVKDLGVNTTILVPSVAAVVPPEAVPSLNTMILVGERMNAALISQWGHLNLINAYGPTECSVACIVQSEVKFETGPQNIGRPYGCEVAVVDPDDHDCLVTRGEPGELIIQGDILAREYLDDPSETAKVFVQGAKWQETQQRLYKTGDLVRENVDGTFEYLGRKDLQVKIGGQRFEIEEIEHHLLAHDDIRQAVVLYPQSGRFSRKLVAVLQPRIADPPPTLEFHKIDIVLQAPPKGLVELLRRFLPPFAVPEIFLTIESVPHLPSGKVDRQRLANALAAVETQNPFVLDESQSLGPRTSIEVTIWEILSEILDVRMAEIPGEVSFIRLGGDSISAMRLVSRCRRANVLLTVDETLRSTSLHQLAKRAKRGTAPMTIPTATEGTDFNLAPIQRMFFDLVPHGENHFNQSFILRLKTTIKSARLCSALEVVVRRHGMLRAAFHQSDEGAWKQSVSTDGRSSTYFQSHSVSSIEEARAEIQQLQSTLDIRKGPVFRADMFQMQSGQVLSLIAHHLLIDLVSWRVILQDLQECLDTGVLPSAMPLSFQDWCVRQEQYASEHLHPDTAYPLSLEDVPEDFWGMDGKTNTYLDRSQLGITLDEPTTRLLLRDCHIDSRTDAVDVFLTALLHSFSDIFPDYNSPIVFNEGHGRETWDPEIDSSQTVGWFTTLYPLQVASGSTSSFLDVLKRVKDSRQMIARNGWAYFTSRFLNPAGKRFYGGVKPEIVFNYSGLYQELYSPSSMFELIPGAIEESASKHMPRFSLIEVAADVEGDILRLSIAYNRHMAHSERILSWFEKFPRSLVEIGRYLLHHRFSYLPSEFPLLSSHLDCLEKLLNEKLPSMGIHRQDVEDIYPCSPVQRGILLSQAKDASLYTTRTVWTVVPTLHHQVDIQKLEAAWALVVQKHCSLRTIFAGAILQNGDPVQIVVKKTSTILQADSYTATTINDGNRISTLRKSRLPRRFSICQNSDGGVSCELTISHTVMDGHSMDIIVRDLLWAYDGKLQMSAPSSYQNFIKSPEICAPSNEARNYWRGTLKDPKTCFLPSLMRSPQGDHALQTIRFYVEESKFKALARVCRTHNITLSTMLQLAWALVLRAYTSQDEVNFGYMASGRAPSIDCVDEVVGAFANLIIFHSHFTPEEIVHDALARLQSMSIQSLAHQYYPLAELRRDLGLQVKGLFNTIMSYQVHDNKQPSRSISLEVASTYEPTEYDLTISIDEFGDRLEVSFGFWADYFSEQPAQYLADSLEETIFSMARDADQKLGDVSVIGQLSRKHILKWNARESEVIDSCIHSIILEQCNQRAEAPAIDAWDQSVSYGQLQRLGTAVAKELSHFRLNRPEMFIPICMEKSVLTIVSMLAVLMAGGAFVLLDTSHPVPRLRDIVGQLSAPVILSSLRTKDLAKQLSEHVHVVTIDQLSNQEDEEPRPLTYEQNTKVPAYAIFTSGSTGTPKGVVVDHAAYSSSAKAHSKAFNMSQTTRALQFASLSFDACLVEILTTLMAGGCVCIGSADSVTGNVAQMIRKFRVNWAVLTPLVADMIIDEDLPSLETLVVAGDAMTYEQIVRWKHRPLRLINGYGPSEASVCATVNRDVRAIHGPSNIGQAVGCRSWVVSRSDQLLPVGAIGELIIDGPILARGYLGDRRKTEAVFTSRPAALGGSVRTVYHTGDLVRYDEDGSLRFVGRQDTQVKISGQRVELGEIERVLQSLTPSYQTVVEVVKAHSSDKTFLAAFFALSSDLEGPATILDHDQQSQDHFKSIATLLGDKLARHMIPSLFILVSKLPLRPSGKLNREQLRKLVKEATPSQLDAFSLANKKQEGSSPKTRAEEQMADLWSRVLLVPASEIGVQSHFFHIGGDSLSAMKLVGHAERQALRISVAQIFQNPTLKQMAAISTNDPRQAELERRPVLPFSLIKDLFEESGGVDRIVTTISRQCRVDAQQIQDILPCSAMQEGLVALSNKQTGAYLAEYRMRISTTIDVTLFKKAWERAYTANEILRTRIVSYESQLLQVLVNESIEWNEIEKHGDGRGLRRLSSPDSGVPLVEFAISDTTNGRSEGLFSIAMHHAAYDGWSFRLILKQVEDFYHGHHVPPSVQYRHFIANESRDADKTEAFWKGQFIDTDTRLYPDIPASSVKQIHQQTSSQVWTCELPVAPRGNFTDSTILRATWAVVLAQFTGSLDVCFGAVLSGRNRQIPLVSDIIGPLITTVPLRVILKPRQPIDAFIEQLQLQATDMIPYEHTGLRQIKRYLQRSNDSEFANLLVVQSAYTDSDTYECLGSPLMLVENHAFDTYPLVMECIMREPTQVELRARFDVSTVDALVVANILRQFEWILTHLLKPHDNVCVGDLLGLLNTRDEMLIRDWNKNPPLTTFETIHELFMRQVRQRPDHIAIQSATVQWTYGEVDHLSSVLAVTIIESLGPASNQLIPLCFEKSVWTVVAMLAVLKAGHAFVPMDPSHPELKLQQIVYQSVAKLILCSPAQEALCSSFSCQYQIVCQDTIATFANPDTPCLGHPSNLAYVLFSSGTTGEPKGIEVTHTAFCSSALAHGPEMMNPASRVLQFASYVFDVSLSEIFTTMIIGGTVCVLDEDSRMNNLAAAIVQLRANTAILTPTVAALLSPSQIPCVKTLILTGEAMTQDQVETWSACLRLINAYGPTEASVYSVINSQVGFKTSCRNIGHPMGSLAWVVNPNDHHQLAPIGAIGELLSEGPILARGYLHDEGKTKAAFIENPAWAIKLIPKGSRKRLYKTGDLVRLDENGDLHYERRLNASTKIRGQLVEVTAIEAALKSLLPENSNAAVDCLHDHRYLAAFVSSPDFDLATSGGNLKLIPPLSSQKSCFKDLQRRLSSMLPFYMVPLLWIPLARIPVSTSGKLDRRILREIVSESDIALFLLSELDKRTPESETQYQLRDTWSKALDIPTSDIGIDDNFFHLGGDSVAAIKLVAAVRAHGLSLSVKEIFTRPVLAVMAEALKVMGQDLDAPAKVVKPFQLLSSISQSPREASELAAMQCDLGVQEIEDIYPCTPLQETIMVASIKQGGSYVARHVYGLPKSFDLDRYRAAWHKTVEVHSTLRTRIVAHTTILQVVVKSVPQWEMCQIEEVDSFVSTCNLNVAFGQPLARWILAETLDRRQYFILLLHHAIFDAWSLQLVFSDVVRAYHDAASIPSTPYRLFVEYYMGIDPSPALSFWRDYLSEYPAAHFPAQSLLAIQDTIPQTADMVYVLPLKWRAKSSVTLSTLLRAAWAVVIASYTNSDDVAFCSTLSGRNAPLPGIDRVQGPAIATVPVRVKVQDGQLVRDFLENVHKEAVQMMGFEQCGLQNIRRISDDAREACDSRNILIIQAEPVDQPDDLGLQALSIPLEPLSSYPLAIECFPGQESVGVTAHYDSSIIHPDQMNRILHHFGHIVERLALEQNSDVASLKSPSDLDDQTIRTWNATVPPLIEKCVHEIIQANAHQSPASPAVCSWDITLSHEELDRLSFGMAGELVRIGVRPEKLVPICCERSGWFPVALLAILKAGGAFIPWDPGHPEERRREVVRQTGAQIIVTTRKHARLCSDLADTLYVMDPERLMAQYLRQRAVEAPKQDPASAAYVIYTSGSTGKVCRQLTLTFPTANFPL